MKKVISVMLAVLLAFTFSAISFAADENAKKPFENSSFFKDGAYTLHYRTYEPETEPEKQIMLLHGFCLSTASFEGLAEEYVKNGYRVVLVDLPNFGYSSRETVFMTLVDRETLVEDLMAELGGKWILGGHSMGGAVAANIAIDCPETVSGLLLFAPQTTQPVNPVMSFFIKSFPVRAMYEVAALVATRIPSLVRMLVDMSFSDSEYAKTYDVSRIADPLKQPGTGSGVAIMATHTRSTDTEAFGKLTVPIVIIKCENDQVAIEENIDALINSSPQKLEVITFDCGGHMFMEYSPEKTAEVTLGTIAQAV